MSAVLVVVLVAAIVILLALLFGRRRGFGGYQRTYQNRQQTPFYEPPMGGPGFGPGPGFGGVGSFMGGMATGALLSYLFDQGRIDMDQYNYFNGLDQQRMMDELMNQNILQQQEIDDLQLRLNDYGNDPYQAPSNDFPGSSPVDNRSYDDPYSNVDYTDDSNNDNNDNWV